MEIVIYTNGAIQINKELTGVYVRPENNKTLVYVAESQFKKTKYKELSMPHERYSLNSDYPYSGGPGLSQFKEDLIKVLKQEKIIK